MSAPESPHDRHAPSDDISALVEAARTLLEAYDRADATGALLVRMMREAQQFSPAAEAFLLEVAALPVTPKSDYPQ